MKSEGHGGAPECSLMAAVKMFLSGVNSERLVKCWLPVNCFIHQDKRKISLNDLPLFVRKGLNFKSFSEKMKNYTDEKLRGKMQHF